MDFSQFALHTKLAVAAIGLYVVYYAYSKITRAAALRKLAREHGCKPVGSRYPHFETLYGVDLVFENTKAYREHRFLAQIQKRVDKLGYTFTQVFLGRRSRSP